MSVRREALEGIAGRCGSLFNIALLTHHDLCQKLEQSGIDVEDTLGWCVRPPRAPRAALSWPESV